MINEVIASLFVWTAAQMGVTGQLPHPDIQMVTDIQRVQMAIPDDAAAVFMLDGEHTGKIMLTEHVDLTTTKGKSFVVHEMVHYFQHHAGYFKTTSCAASSEPLAYKIQNQYLVAHNEPTHSTESFVKFISVCWRVTDK